jgi:hypothetical protein
MTGNIRVPCIAKEVNRLMPLRKVITTYCENDMKHTNTFCGQTAEFGMLKQVVYIITVGL